MTALVVAADASRARLFSCGRDQVLREVADLANPEARMHEGDLVADHAGRRGANAMEAKQSRLGGDSMKRHRIEEFAAQISERAARGMRDAEAQSLCLICPPEMMGLLRRVLADGVRARVTCEITRSMAGAPLDEIRGALPPRL